MSDPIRPGRPVRVVFPPKHLCHAHNAVKTEGQIGQADRLDARLGDHPVVVIFWGVRHPPFNYPWVETFSAVELEVIPEPP